MSVHFHSNKCTNTLPGAGCPEMIGAAPACPPLPAPPLALAPPVVFVAPAVPGPPPLTAAPAAPELPPPASAPAPELPPPSGPGSDPVPQAARAVTVAKTPLTKIARVFFTLRGLTVLARVQPVKPNHGKIPAFTDDPAVFGWRTTQRHASFVAHARTCIGRGLSIQSLHWRCTAARLAAMISSPHEGF